MNLIECITSKKFDEANAIIAEKFEVIVAQKLSEMKKMVSAKSHSDDRTGQTCTKCHKGKYHETSHMDDWDGVLHCDKCGHQVKRHIREELEEEQLDEGRFKIVKARIRGGKIQRRKKISTVKGYTFRAGKLTRMSASERRKRKMGQRRGKIKRKAKMSRALMKRKRSMMKRKVIGLR